MDQPSKKQCQLVVQEVVYRRGWKLITDLGAFSEEVYAEVRKQRRKKAGKGRNTIERATVRRYSVHLHRACGGSDPERERVAFGDLWNYFYSVACAKTRDRDIAWVLAQQALSKTYENLWRCRDPERFLGYAWLILLNVIRDHYRALKTAREIPGFVEDDLPTGDDEERHAIPMKFQSGNLDPEHEGSLIDRLLDDESLSELLDLIRSCVPNPLWQSVLIDFYIRDMEYQEIAEDLNIKVSYVQVLRGRGLNALSNCERFIRFSKDRLRREAVISRRELSRPID